MADKQPMQADGGSGDKAAMPDGTNETDGAGESGGGAYPNPHRGNPGDRDKEQEHHGGGDLGDESVGKDG